MLIKENIERFDMNRREIKVSLKKYCTFLFNKTSHWIRKIMMGKNMIYQDFKCLKSFGECTCVTKLVIKLFVILKIT